MDIYAKQRMKMVASQIRSRGIRNERLLKVMELIPRHIFVDEGLADQAYSDNPLPIGEGQTISQPYIVALMTEALELKGDEKVLEIGTGSGYQSAILSKLADRVFSIEKIAPLAGRARSILDSLDCFNVLTRVGDGSYGWRNKAPFDGIIVTAGAPDIPRPILEQLTIGGNLIIPVGNLSSQTLLKLTRLSEDIEDVKREELGGCRFVSLVGEYGWGS
jgi:protein-L-isoaspartate(D-aspartate) O-methyltransferase